MKTARTLLAAAALVVLGGYGVERNDGIGISSAAALDPPTCTNGDCSGPPVCTNGDCGPPSCTNGDCGELANCCCLGPNTEGTIRVCCCPSPNLDGMTCRESLVLGTGFPDNWHETLVQETLEGKRPEACDRLLEKFCDPPVENVCAMQKGKKVCKKVLKKFCSTLTNVCAYRYCGPTWFPFDEPTPDMAGCEWWNKVRDCTE